MCGISGFLLASPGPPRAELAARAGAMAQTLRHRGPDGAGAWADEESGVGLGHRRLAVIDLSDAGSQPMRSPGGRYRISYNGEVYNHPELRRELEAEGVLFRGRSDTEVLLAAIESWGLAAALRRANGMFAFALWDARERELVLARDRLGIKPLYYALLDGELLFASELKALRVHPRWRGEIDRDAAEAMLRYGYVPSPRSIYRQVHKLPPGATLTARAGAAGEPDIYWSPAAVLAEGADKPYPGGRDEAAEELEELLGDAVRLRHIADVPVGAFLSGGIDSSAVVALLQRAGGRAVRSFTVGFAETAYDESPHARRVAAHLGTDHTELRLSAGEARDSLPRLPALYDEPFADSSQIPTHLVSVLARKTVTVALSGDGGDELFGGYIRHLHGARLWRRIGWLPASLRRPFARAVQALPAHGGLRLWRAMETILPGWLGARDPADSFHRAASLIGAADAEVFYDRLLGRPLGEKPLVLGASGGQTGARLDPRLPGWARRFMAADLAGYLPDDILVKVDRASMAVGLEVRVPFLDHRVAEWSARLPARLLFDRRGGKSVVRRLLAKHLPPALYERPKAGFALPLGEWLRGGLRDWAEALVDGRSLRAQGLLDPAPVRAAWEEHLAGTRDRSAVLWRVLMLQAWVAEARRA